MSISRYKKENIVKNNDLDYRKSFSSRIGSGGLLQTGTTVFKKPSDEDILNIKYITETWGLGKRLYKMSFKYYGDSQYWWLIALFNNIGIESDIVDGQIIKIPVPLEIVLNLYGF